jgi:hypothetical protein
VAYQQTTLDHLAELDKIDIENEDPFWDCDEVQPNDKKIGTLNGRQKKMWLLYGIFIKIHNNRFDQLNALLKKGLNPKFLKEQVSLGKKRCELFRDLFWCSVVEKFSLNSNKEMIIKKGGVVVEIEAPQVQALQVTIDILGADCGDPNCKTCSRHRQASKEPSTSPSPENEKVGDGWDGVPDR